MLKKIHKKLHSQWMTGRLNLMAVAKRMGYRKGGMGKGLTRVRTLLADMGITIL